MLIQQSDSNVPNTLFGRVDVVENPDGSVYFYTLNESVCHYEVITDLAGDPVRKQDNTRTSEQFFTRLLGFTLSAEELQGVQVMRLFFRQATMAEPAKVVIWLDDRPMSQ